MLLPLRGLGSRGSIFFHCRSVNIGLSRGIRLTSCHIMAAIHTPIQVPASIPNQVMKQFLECWVGKILSHIRMHLNRHFLTTSCNTICKGTFYIDPIVQECCPFTVRKV